MKSQIFTKQVYLYLQKCDYSCEIWKRLLQLINDHVWNRKTRSLWKILKKCWINENIFISTDKLFAMKKVFSGDTKAEFSEYLTYKFGTLEFQTCVQVCSGVCLLLFHFIHTTDQNHIILLSTILGIGMWRIFRLKWWSKYGWNKSACLEIFYYALCIL